MTTAECLKLGDFTAAASGQAIFPELKGLYSGCGGDGICGWSDSPRACIGTGTISAPGYVLANYESNAGLGNSGNGNWDYGGGKGVEKVTCKPRSSGVRAMLLQKIWCKYANHPVQGYPKRMHSGKQVLVPQPGHKRW